MNMTAAEILAAIAAIEEDGRGQYHTIHGRKPIPMKKGFAPYWKDSIFQMRLAHDYENQKSTRLARLMGRAKLGLPDYYEVLSPCLIRHVGNGTVYLRGQPSGNIPVTRYLNADGAEVSKEEAMANALKKSSPKKDEWMNYKLENVLSIV